MLEKRINSVAILDLFQMIPINFLLNNSISSNNIFNFIILLISKLYCFIAIYRTFYIIILNFCSFSLFLLDVIFNYLVKVSKNLSIAKNNYGGGEK